MWGSIEQPRHILVVEDDAEMRHLLSCHLRDSGFLVTSVGDGRQMRRYLAAPSAAIDLVLLDIMLPGASGIDLLKDLRASSSLPVVLLTALGDETDRVLGLEFGADDYIAKPFGRRELVARLRAVLRRVGATPESPSPAVNSLALGFEGWVLSIGRRELVSPKGVLIDLSATEFDLLMAFLANPQRVLGRDQLMEAAHRRLGDAFDRSVDVQVSRLRRKIEPSGAPNLIKTVRGAGYIFVGEVMRL
ncbi:response regulator [Rhodovarius crocodyli]|uniref:response regulator n=1 Tax=Rhodovarius crocodyli TaxID=1979269 RepID=UPI0023EA58F0|nr:response regulator transcription factor [Rhodovarius crocodyli]